MDKYFKIIMTNKQDYNISSYCEFLKYVIQDKTPCINCNKCKNDIEESTRIFIRRFK